MPSAGPAPAPQLRPRRSWRFDAIGTVWQIETATALDEGVRAEITELIDRFDREWSRFRSDSVVSRIASGGAAFAPPDAADMLGTYVELSTATGGAVNPLIGASLERLGYDTDYSLIDRGAAPAPHDWTERLTWSDERLALTSPGVIDIGALGKGRLVDLVLDAVSAHVVGDIVVDAGGDLAVRGASQRIGLEHPFDPRRAIGLFEVTDASLCASATNRRVWGEGLHHVLDARTGTPVRTIVATWAVSATTMRADAIATALFFDGGAQLAHNWGVEWVRMTTDGRVEWSPGCRAEIFTA